MCVCKLCVSKLCVGKLCVCVCKLCVGGGGGRSMSSSATPATQSEGRCHKVPRLPRKTPRRPSAPGTQARHQSQPSAISATPATQSHDPCHQVPRLPRKVTIHVIKCPRLPHKVKVDVTKCHACHAKRRGVPAPPGTQARHQSQPSAISATPATQSDDPCHQVPCLPRVQVVCVCAGCVCASCV